MHVNTPSWYPSTNSSSSGPGAISVSFTQMHYLLSSFTRPAISGSSSIITHTGSLESMYTETMWIFLPLQFPNATHWIKFPSLLIHCIVHEYWPVTLSNLVPMICERKQWIQLFSRLGRKSVKIFFLDILNLPYGI